MYWIALKWACVTFAITFVIVFLIYPFLFQEQMRYDKAETFGRIALPSFIMGVAVFMFKWADILEDNINNKKGSEEG